MTRRFNAALAAVFLYSGSLHAGPLTTGPGARVAPRAPLAPPILPRSLVVPRAGMPSLSLPIRPEIRPFLTPSLPWISVAPLAELPEAVSAKIAPVPSLMDRAERFLRSAKSRFFPQHQSPDDPAAIVSSRRVSPERLPSDDEMRSEMALSPLTNPDREKAVIELFQEAGARRDEITLQDAGRGRHNISVVKKGRTDKVIVVGAHHDKVEEGAGTIDNWSGTTMMINLYQEIRDLDTEATYIFIAFSREEEGLIGSEFYLDSLPRSQREKIKAMINLDTLGVDGTFSVKNLSDRVLLDATRRVAAAEGLPVAEISYAGDSDSSTFRRAGIKAMTMAGATPEIIFDIIHSENDTMAYFSLPHYKNAYLLTLALLKSLDRAALN